MSEAVIRFMEIVPIGYDLAEEDCSMTGYSPPRHQGCSAHIKVVRENEMCLVEGELAALLSWVCDCGEVFLADTTQAINS